MDEYFNRADQYCSKSKLDKAVHTLEGLLRGVAADDIITDEEKNAVSQWIDEHQHFAARHPFNEIIPELEQVFSNDDMEERVQDILWLCDKLKDVKIFYDVTTADMQTLQGIINGILADNIIEVKELQYLLEWIQEHPHLKGLWPYDEIESLAIGILEDGIIDDEEHETLLRFFDDFQRYVNDERGDVIAENMTVQGICAVDPEIQFENMCFCVTGKSTKASRKEFENKIKELGGTVTGKVGKGLDFLVIGAGGSSCWTYSCYGRKIEKAMKLRKEGTRVAIVHEYDFWDAV